MLLKATLDRAGLAHLTEDATFGGQTKLGMTQGGFPDPGDSGARQAWLTQRYLKVRSTEWLGQVLNDDDRFLLFEDLKSHYELHQAQGNAEEAQLMLEDLFTVSQAHERLRYDQRCLAILNVESRGLGGRALEMMGQFYHYLGGPVLKSDRAAEVAMEYGILEDRHGTKSKALSLFRAALTYYEREGRGYNLCAAHFNIASALYDLGQVEEALRTCHEGLRLEGGHFLELRAHLLLQRANCLERTGDLGLACEDYLRAATAYEALGHYRQQTNILFRVGWLEGRRPDGRDPISTLAKALRLAKELDYAGGLARFHLYRAEGLASVGSRSEAMDHLKQCLPYAQWGRLHRLEKLARGLLYRLSQPTQRSLTFFMRARGPRHQDMTLERAGAGTYSHRRDDGGAQRPWRDIPRVAGQDVSFLVRLLAELGRRSRQPTLVAQSFAVMAWQRTMREGRRTL